MKAILLLTDLFVWMVIYGALLLVMAFIVGKIAPRMPNKVSRFVVLFVLGVPYCMAYGYSKDWLHGSKMSWTEALILALPPALLSAILFTFWFPVFGKSNTR